MGAVRVCRAELHHERIQLGILSSLQFEQAHGLADNHDGAAVRLEIVRFPVPFSGPPLKKHGLPEQSKHSDEKTH